MNEPIIKEDGMSGLLYAYDQNGILVSADDAVGGRRYKCPICGCTMCLRKLSSGKHIFARMPGQTHTNSICITIETKKKKYSFKDKTPLELISSFCHTTPRKTPPSPGGGGNPSPGGPKDDTDIETAAFTSLKQICESGIDYLNADDMYGDYRVSDFIITNKYGSRFFNDPGFRLGARIVYARYIRSDSKTKSITFAQFMNGDYTVRFRLVFLNTEEFKKVRDKFGRFEEDKETGRTVFVKNRKNQDVLIACDNWEYIGKDRCRDLCDSSSDYCKNCRGMYQAIYTSSKQLFLVPADH